MGIPSLYRWLCGKYPKIIEPVKNNNSIFDENSYGLNDVNGFDVDNFYIDTNGLIHPICHPQGVEPPKTEEEMYELIIKLLKRLIFMIHPKNLIYIAIDGVAPRAKMNQQRIRRANAARDAEIEEKVAKEIIEEMKEKGLTPPEYHKKWDSNAITPGTNFMIRLNERIKEFIRNDLMNNEKLKNVKVIFNSSEVVGEGEHKIMNFIRQQRLYPSYNANTCHCIYGLDADLIVLSLATHEVNMKILRENTNMNNNNNSYNNNNNVIHFKDINDIIYKTEYEILNISTLREYLARIEFCSSEFKDLDFELNFEHVVDDLIFLIMFVGNDFLPHVPSINIREGAIDVMIFYYKKYLGEIGGYLIENCKCQFDRISKYLKELSKLEPIIFKLRYENQKSYEEYLSRKMNNSEIENSNDNKAIKRPYIDENNNNESENQSNNKKICNTPVLLNDGGYSDNDNYRYSKLLRKEIFDEEEEEKEKDDDDNNNENNDEMEVIEKEEIDTNKELFLNKIHEKCNNEKKVIYEDKVHLEEAGYRERYYRIKFENENENENENNLEELIKRISMEYMKGIEWIMNYYYDDCISWNWYYPYHYSPFLCDLCLINECEWSFELNKPLKCLEELMSVLPGRSNELVPKCYRDLMINPKSSIYKYYKNDFKIDGNGNKESWLYVSLLEVIDEELLLKTLKSKENELSEEEKKINKEGEIVLYINNKNENKEILMKFTEKSVKEDDYILICDIGLNGLIKKINENNDKNDIELYYKLEEPLRKHECKLLNKAKLPKMKLNENDIYINHSLKKGIVYKYVLENIH